MTYDIIVTSAQPHRNKFLADCQRSLVTAGCLLALAVGVTRCGVALTKPAPPNLLPSVTTVRQVDAMELVTASEASRLVGGLADGDVQSHPINPLLPRDRQWSSSSAFQGKHRMLEVEIGPRRIYEHTFQAPPTNMVVSPVKGLGDAAVFLTQCYLRPFNSHWDSNHTPHTTIDGPYNTTWLRVLKGNVGFGLVLTSEGLHPTAATLNELLKLGNQAVNRLPVSAPTS
ncbi:MAG: hypothetical protein JO316_10690 [Abitibacteriaceae bacterium]|nr:hypothetical protein [Abditibacteriaceae bacterium]MBV9865810.1 hypothetical protein [Abditibacteriaceae bacterium]